MFLKDYLANLTNALNDYAELGLIAASELSTDFRSDKIGFLSGKIAFIDGSTLFFKEYLDLRYRVDKKTYSFHYQDCDALLRFRYDNALHKPDPGFLEHKHVADDIIPAAIPDLRDILEEIAQMYFAE